MSLSEYGCVPKFTVFFEKCLDVFQISIDFWMCLDVFQRLHCLLREAAPTVKSCLPIEAR